LIRLLHLMPLQNAGIQGHHYHGQNGMPPGEDLGNGTVFFASQGRGKPHRRSLKRNGRATARVAPTLEGLAMPIRQRVGATLAVALPPVGARPAC
jgi:hypothetical protein